ncbi:MAG TPA: ATP-binding protein [Steroidobacteraceae bacterium]|nr:ATP-binding protein [Steroidobacteraceae bacterium]
MNTRYVHVARGYALAAGATALALLLRTLAEPWLSGYFRLTMLYGAVALAVRYGGVGPGAAAALVGYFASNYLFLEPHGSFAIESVGQRSFLGFVSYALSCAIIIALATSLRRARRRAELDTQDRRTSEERFRVAIESSAVPFAILKAVRGPSGAIVDFEWAYLNAAASREIREQPEKLIGRRIGDVFPWSWKVPGLFDSYCRAVETGEPQTIEVTASPHGAPEWFHNVAKRFGDGVAVWFADVTERRLAEVAINEARTQLQTVTDLMPAGMTRCSRDLRYIWVNRQFTQWVAEDASEVVGRPIRDVIGAKAYEVFEPYYQQVLTGARVELEQEVEFLRTGRHWINCVYVPTFAADGTVDGWVGVITDITHRKHLELAQNEADHRKDEFLAMLAHELRNPLAPIRSATEYLRLAGPPEPNLSRARDIIDRQVQHLTRLVDDLLDLSRVTQGHIELQRQRVSVAVAIGHALEASGPAIIDAGHDLNVQLPSEALYVEADLTRLAQMIGNLLNNAAKYTPRGGRIDVRAQRDAGQVIVEVSDSGIGIPREMLPRIFDMFVQVDRTPVRAKEGLGIGLTLVNRLVRMHGGTVEARSEGTGRGSTFTIRLPLAEPPSLETPQRSEPPPEPLAIRSEPRRVLIVDDNLDVAVSLAMLVGALGHETRMAHDGVQALATLEEFQADAVLLDIGLPRLNGYEVARRIRSDPRTRTVQVIALTGWGQEQDRRRAREAGFDHHLVKPVDLSVLMALLGQKPQPQASPASAQTADLAYD